MAQELVLRDLDPKDKLHLYLERKEDSIKSIKLTIQEKRTNGEYDYTYIYLSPAGLSRLASLLTNFTKCHEALEPPRTYEEALAEVIEGGSDD